jgi:transcriptional regulator with XRE-family HTH domain
MKFDSVPRMTADPVGILIQRARHRKSWTQQQLADELGVSKPTVANWERGAHFPLRYAGALEALLEITIPAPETAASK